MKRHNTMCQARVESHSFKERAAHPTYTKGERTFLQNLNEPWQPTFFLFGKRTSQRTSHVLHVCRGCQTSSSSSATHDGRFPQRGHGDDPSRVRSPYWKRRRASTPSKLHSRSHASSHQSPRKINEYRGPRPNVSERDKPKQILGRTLG